MNKSALRNFATKARRELLERVEVEARKIGITKDKVEDATVESSDAIFINDRQLTDIERTQRNKLITRIEEIGFDRVMEETAYTWFNRFVALRFMEVNDYLPTRVRVLSSENEDSTEPDMITEALSLNLDIDKDYIYNLKLENRTDELFKYLIKLHCNDLNRYMPFMFETIEDYMAILFPEGLLGTDSFVREMTDTEVIPEDNWENVEIIGWLYQYYIAEEKDKIFANLKKNIKITQDTLPAATQLFTPNWIVRYMVENSLGRIWLESYPDSSLKDGWEYYLEEADQKETVINELDNIRYKDVEPEKITFLDPACGSGHVLIYAFDILYDMYLEKGYLANEVPKLIMEKNLYGIDVDNRAAQLASFALMMKAREKSRRIFRQQPQLNIISIQDSNWLTSEMIDKISKHDTSLKNDLHTIKDRFENAKEFGSLLSADDINFENIDQKLNEYINDDTDLFEYSVKEKVSIYFPKIFKQIDFLKKKYDVVCTNPPYMGRRSMNPILNKFLDKNYSKTKADLFAAFIKKSFNLAKSRGLISMITMESWMFLSSYKDLREEIVNQKTILRLIHMPYEGRGRTSLGINFGTSAFVFRNYNIMNYRNINMYIRYNEIDKEGIPKTYPVINERYKVSNVDNFKKIPRTPIAYWISENFIEIFSSYKSISNSFIPKFGMSVGDGQKYIREWHEVEINKINFNASNHEKFIDSNQKYALLDKGGPFRRWYGNKNQVVLWENDGKEIKENPKSAVRSPQYFFKPHISWTLVTSSIFSARYFEEGFILDTASNCLYFKIESRSKLYALGLLNTKFTQKILNIINPTINYSCGVVGLIPYKVDNNLKQTVDKIVLKNINISKLDWSFFENSWDFKKHPLLKFPSDTIDLSFNQWEEFTESQFNQLKENEEELNRIFIYIYGLQDELTPDVKDEDVTVRKADLERDIKSFISYAVGCMFGRYSLDEEGLVYAGGEFDLDRYKTFPADENNVLPILPGAYFEDDIVTKFVQFLEVTFGEETLEENLQFIADAIGRRKNETPREAIRRYFLTPSQFYGDHVRTYKRTPIYWMFTSGRERAFNCLIYMHRYDQTTLSRIRTDYLHDVQTRYETEKQDLQAIIEGDSTSKEVRDATRELKSVDRKLEELKDFDEKLHHLADMQIDIDLDDGVRENYKKFEGLLAPIR